ncbi:fimbrial protein [Pseudomonas citronellolis]|uniref:fimbrial protein n=1 Tax=Pseudomonas citronellolis TaxID=53408 RepID=UPI0023E4075A|nr:fimbrial protein [Pseudomonas citronellolis]MDF3935615.1 fimbrial protein [Pseudomonas citronellolis]
MPFQRMLPCLLLALLAGVCRAECSFESGYSTAQSSIGLPASLAVPRDAAVGSELWSSGWVAGAGPSIVCDGEGRVGGQLAAGIGAPLPGFASAAGFPSVFATNVEGIGVSVYWCNMDACNPDFLNVTPLASLAWPVVPARYPLGNSWWVRLLKTGPIAGGLLQLGGASEVRYQDLAVARLTLSGASAVASLGCEVSPGSRSLSVALPTVARADFPAGPGALADDSKARALSIDMSCDAGVRVNYRIDGASSGDDVLDNASGAGMASGIGVRLYRGQLGSRLVQPLGVPLLHAVTASAGQLVSIPLTARYYRTAGSLGAGRVAVTATFTLSYE